ncbi:MAG: hypothetical protein Q9224_006562, partial [Gallowayella concinna]
MRQVQRANILALVFVFCFSIFFMFATAHPASPHPIHHSARIKCDPRTTRPMDPAFQDCDLFLGALSVKAHGEPPGAFRYYGRNIGSCPLCVNLPVILHFGAIGECAALIDVDDKHAMDF